MTVRPTLGPLPNARSFRGQPLIIMLAVLALWIGVRVSVWSPMIDEAVGAVRPAGTGEHYLATGAARTEDRDRSPSRLWPARSPEMADVRYATAAASPSATPWLEPYGHSRPDPVDSGSHSALLPTAVPPLLVTEGRISVPDARQIAPQNAALSSPTPLHRPRDARRLSVDGWLFLREGSVTGASAGPFAPTYGRSQLGAVLRYGLDSRSRHSPQAYLRATGAIDSREADVAGGLSVQPLSALPVRAHAEVRLSRLGDRVELRPSAFITAGIDEPLTPFDARLRGYAQAGYVGGEFATAFADGNLVAERAVTRFERGTLAIGAGAWGGAQRGSARFDTGPTASLDLQLGKGMIRLAADYRFRVAGEAEPSSGAALTLSTSF